MTNKEYRIIFESEEQPEVYRGLWLELLIASGWAGILPNGRIVDRRYYPESMPIKENKVLGIAKPKEVKP